MLAHRVIKGRDVYARSEEVFVGAHGQAKVGGKFFGAFQLHEPGFMTAGEFVRDDGKVKLFASTDDAVEAAFSLAEARLM